MSVFEFNPASTVNLVKNWNSEVALGNIAGVTSMLKFGRNPDVDTGTEDVWDGGGIWTDPTGSSLIKIQSTSTNDSTGGSGAQTITVKGLSSANLLSSETVTMTGTTQLTTTNSYSMVHRMFVRSAGSSGFNIGNITALNPSDTTAVLAQITAQQNQTLMAIFKIPADKTGLMTSYYANAHKDAGGAAASGMTAVLVAKPDGEVYQIKHTGGFGAGVQSSGGHNFQPYNSFSALTTLKIRATSNADNITVSGGFDLELHDN